MKAPEDYICLELEFATHLRRSMRRRRMNTSLGIEEEEAECLE
jgi:TorA maturation chaperone TorD